MSEVYGDSAMRLGVDLLLESSGRIRIQRWIMASRRVSCRSFSMKDVTLSRSTNKSCLDRMITSAANETPTGSGGREVDCYLRAFARRQTGGKLN